MIKSAQKVNFMAVICIKCKSGGRCRCRCRDDRPRQANGRLEPWARKNDDLKYWREQIAQFRANLENRRVG